MDVRSSDSFRYKRELRKKRSRFHKFIAGVGLRPRLFAAFFLVSLIPLILLFCAQYQVAKRNTLHLIETSLDQVVEGQQQRFNLELQRLLDQVKLVSSRTQMRISLMAYNQTGATHDLDLLKRIMDDALLSMEHFVGIWIRDPDDSLVTGFFAAGSDVLSSLDPPVMATAAEQLQLQLQLQWGEEELPYIWASWPLSLADVNIGSIHLLVTIKNIYAVLEDFDCKGFGWSCALLLPAANQQVKVLALTCPDHFEEDQGFYHLLESTDLYSALIGSRGDPAPAYHHGQITMVRQLNYGFGDVLVHGSPAFLEDIFWGQMHYLVLMTVFTLALVLTMAFVLTRMIVRPVKELTKATAVMHYGSTDVRIKERYWGEFTELARSFNRAMRMLSRRTRELNREIEARRRSQEKLIDLANTDTLTGLMNRRFFLEKLREELSSPTRERQPAALLYLDLDDFKPINDTMGHEAGDLVLQIVAGRIRHLLREGDLAARLGGDEFALILMKNEGHPLDPDLVLKRIEEQLALPMTIKDQVVSVICSIGIARLSPGADPHEVLNLADQEMYRIKHARREKDENI